MAKQRIPISRTGGPMRSKKEYNREEEVDVWRDASEAEIDKEMRRLRWEHKNRKERGK